jgi:hypothetical protein
MVETPAMNGFRGAGIVTCADVDRRLAFSRWQVKWVIGGQNKACSAGLYMSHSAPIIAYRCAISWTAPLWNECRRSKSGGMKVALSN